MSSPALQPRVPGAAPSPAGGSPRPPAVRALVLQDGARRRYALPLALQRAGILERAYIDFFASPGSVEGLAAKLVGYVRPAGGRKLRERYCAELDAARVVRNPWLTLRLQVGRRRFATSDAAFRWVSTQLGRWVLRRGFGRANALIGFIRNLSPELCAGARRGGLTTVGDQIIAPAAVEHAEMQRQARRWPEWAPLGPGADHELTRDWEEQTWGELDHITCMSPYVRDGLLSQGISPQRVTVIPYPFDVGGFPAVERMGRRERITVGFVGEIGLRKGAPYFFEVARRMDARRFRFVMLGPVRHRPPESAAREARVELVPPVPRSQVRAWLEQFDVFFFPSTCEGSAGAVMEAMASGLPVVTTPNSGTLARDGEEGFLAAYDDVDRFVDCIQRLGDDADLRARMGAEGRRRVQAFSPEWYSRTLAALLSDVVGGMPPVGAASSLTGG